MKLNRDRILITGSGGMLGSYVDFGARMTRDLLDVSDLQNVRSVLQEYKPSVILHLAAATNLGKCENNPEIAYQANAVGSYNVALVAREIGAQVVYVSTCAVFDGNKEDSYMEDDTPSPQNHYSHSKYLGELAVSCMAPNHIIARTGWMFGGGPEKDSKFVAIMLKQLHKSSIEVANDTWGTPTYGKDFINAIIQLVEEEKVGVFHVGNYGTATRADIAREIVRITGSSTKIVEVDTENLTSFKANFVSGKNQSISSHTVHLRPWQEALEGYIRTEWSDIV